MKIPTFKPSTDGWVHIDHNAKLWKTPEHCEPNLDFSGCSGESRIWALDNLSWDDEIEPGVWINYEKIKNWTECKWKVKAGEIFGIKVTNGHAEIVRIKGCGHVKDSTYKK